MEIVLLPFGFIEQDVTHPAEILKRSRVAAFVWMVSQGGRLESPSDLGVGGARFRAQGVVEIHGHEFVEGSVGDFFVAGALCCDLPFVGSGFFACFVGVVPGTFASGTPCDKRRPFLEDVAVVLV